MALPTGYTTFNHYSITKDDIPEHKGSKHMYGSFVVTNRTDIKSSDFLPDGGIAILGKGWVPEGGWYDADTNSDGIRKPTGFIWGVIIRQRGRGNNGVHKYVLASFNTAAAPTWTASNAVGSALNTLNDALSDVTNNYDHYQYSDGSGNFNIPASKFSRVKGANNEFASNTDDVLVSYYGNRLDGYQFTQTLANSNVSGVKITRLVSNHGSNNRYFRVKGFDDKDKDGVQDGGETTEVRDHFDPGGDIITDDVTGTAVNIADYANANHIYLEDTRYGDDAKVYRSYSESVPVSIVAGVGEVWVNVKYWGNSPLHGREPYQNKTIRIISPTKARDAFWTC